MNKFVILTLVFILSGCGGKDLFKKYIKEKNNYEICYPMRNF